MNLQADIDWLKTELDKVKDPDFLVALKGMFNYRNNKSNTKTNELVELLTNRALKSENDINTGNVLSIDAANEYFERSLKE